MSMKHETKAVGQSVQYKEEDLLIQSRKAKQLKMGPKSHARPNLKPNPVDKRQLELMEQKRKMHVNVRSNLPQGKEVATAFNAGAGFAGHKQVSQGASVQLNKRKTIKG
jgi:hypothetical protein